MGGAGGGRAALDGDAVVRGARAVGERVAADDRFRDAGDRKLEGEVLAGFERRKRFAVVGREVERIRVVALVDFLRDGEFADAVPGGAGELDGLDAELGGADVEGEALLLETGAAAFEEKPANVAAGPETHLKKQTADNEPAGGLRGLRGDERE